MRSADRSAFVAGSCLILVVAAALQLGQISFEGVWRGFTHGYDAVAAVTVSLSWLATAALLPVRHRAPSLTVAAWVLSIASPLLMLVHGLLLRIGEGGLLGLAFLVAAPLLVVLLRRTWRGDDFRRARRELGLDADVAET